MLSILNKNKKKYLAGIYISETNGIIVIFEKKDDIAIIDRGDFDYSNGWENIIEDIDKTLYHLETVNKIKLSDTIFIIPTTWVDKTESKVKQPYKKYIEQIVKANQLKPLGYITFSDIINKISGSVGNKSQLNLLIEVDQTYIGIFFIKDSNIIEHLQIPRTEDIELDIITALKNLADLNKIPEAEKIYIYGLAKNFDRNVKLIQNDQWQLKIFKKTLAVNIINNPELVLTLTEIINERYYQKSASIYKAAPEGFLINEDVKYYSQTAMKQKQDIDSNDINNTQKQPITFKFKLFNPKNIYLLFGKLPVINKYTFLIAIVLISLLAVFICIFYLYKLELIIYYKKNVYKNSIVLTDGFKVYGAKSVVDVDLTRATTGEKETGTKAKGKITIYNMTSEERSFKQGFTLISKYQKKYLLDNDIRVSSASQEIALDQSITKFGKSEVNATAEFIGAEYNLDKGEKLSLENLSNSQYYALSTTKLSGGTKKKITVVSQSDLKKLRQDAVSQIKSNAKKNITTNNNEILLDKLDSVNLIKQSYSVKENQEANSVNGKFTGAYNYYLINKSEIINIIAKKDFKPVDPNYYSDKESINLKIADVKKTGSNYTLYVDYQINLIYRINENNIKDMIKGKKLTDINDIIGKNNHIKGFEIVNQTKIPIIIQFIPFNKNNIIISSQPL